MKFLKLGGILFVSLIVIGVIAAPKLVEWYVFHDKPELKPLYADYKSKVLTFPADVLEIDPVSEETRAAIGTLQEAWDAHGQAAIDIPTRYQETAAIDYAALDAELAGIRPLLDAWRTAVTRPDYVLVLAPADPAALETGGNLVANFLMSQTWAKLGALQARAQAHAGNYEAALETVDAIHAAARVNPYDTLIAQLITVAMRSIAARVEHDVIAAIDDPTLLRRALASQQDRAGKHMVFPEGLTPSVLDQVGLMRMVKRAGIDVPDLKPMTERELGALAAITQADYQEQIVLPRMKDDPAKAARVQAMIDSYRNMAAMQGGPVSGGVGLASRIGGFYSRPILFAISTPNFSEAGTRGKVSQAQCDLAHLETAGSLYEAENGQAPGDLDALVPATLAELPADPFAMDEAPYRLAKGTVYSVGPDNKDDGLAKRYDPTNGTISRGDIFFAGDASDRSLAAAR
jgi:hypothetical protein